MQDLADVDVGSWVARTPLEIRESEPRAFDFYFRFPAAATFPSGESMAAAERTCVRERWSRWWIDTPNEAVVVVTHELLIRLVLVRLRGSKERRSGTRTCHRVR